MSEVQPGRVKWLWPTRIPLGKISILQGDPGLGKSTIALDIAARITRGQCMPDGSRSEFDGAAGVGLLTAEDGLADTIQPRLVAAGADLQKVASLDSCVEGGMLQIPTDIPRLREAINKLDAKLVIIDPLAAFLAPTINSWNNQQVRRALAPLAQVADITGCAILIIDHLNKAIGRSPHQRGNGSVAFNAAARSVLLVGKNPSDPETFVLASVKSNLGPPSLSLSYETVQTETGASRIGWLGECDYSAIDLVQFSDLPTDLSKVDLAGAFLLESLADGSKLESVLTNEAAAKGINKRALQRASNRLRVRKAPIGFQKHWAWSLPAGMEIVAAVKSAEVTN